VGAGKWWFRTVRCCGSGSVCFLAFRIRIHLYEVRIRLQLRILLSSTKIIRKTLIPSVYL
jgi:hypothetical protein